MAHSADDLVLNTSNSNDVLRITSALLKKVVDHKPNFECVDEFGHRFHMIVTGYCVQGVMQMICVRDGCKYDDRREVVVECQIAYHIAHGWHPNTHVGNDSGSGILHVDGQDNEGVQEGRL